jgi:hypothetical protein
MANRRLPLIQERRVSTSFSFSPDVRNRMYEWADARNLRLSRVVEKLIIEEMQREPCRDFSET